MNNAGVLDDYAPILETDEDLWDKIIGVNLTGVYRVTRALLPSMLEAGGGTIVNTCSIAGLVAGGGGTAYTASKHGVLGLTRQLAFDYGQQGIRVNCICPGAVETGMTKALFEAGDAGDGLGQQRPRRPLRPARGARQPRAVPGQRGLLVLARRRVRGRWWLDDPVARGCRNPGPTPHGVLWCC